jgi:hypothetical protein
MGIRNLDQNGDWLDGHGLADYAQNKNAVILSLKTRLKEFTLDCFFNEPAGIDYFNLLGNKNTEFLLKQQISTVASKTDGVATIENIEFVENRNTREFLISLSVTTIYDNESKNITITI